MSGGPFRSVAREGGAPARPARAELRSGKNAAMDQALQQVMELESSGRAKIVNRQMASLADRA